MPRSSNDRVIAVIARLTLLVALTVAIALPLAFSSLAYIHLANRLETQAQTNADAVTDLVGANPGLWTSQVQRIEQLLTRFPVEMDSEAVSAYDANGVLLALAGNPPGQPMLRRSYPFYDSGRVVGRVEVAHSLRGLIGGAALVALLGLLLSGVVYGVFKSWPLRMLRRMGVALEAEQAALRASEDRYRTLIDWSPEPFSVLRDGKIIYVNPAAVRMFGAMSSQDLLGKPMLDLVHPDFHQIARAREKNLTDHRVNAPMTEMRFLAVNGAAIDVQVEGTAIAYDGELAIRVSMRNITELKQSAAALQESEARFRSLTEMSSDFYWESDVEHRLTQRSESKREVTESVFRYGSSIGKRRWEISYLSPDESGWQKHRAMLDAHLPFREFEISRLRANGARHHICVSGDPMFNAVGEFNGYRGIGTDITERKEAEAARVSLEARLRESQKMEAIGTLAGGIAHDFNNIIATILGNAELARQDVSTNPVALESLEEIRKAGSRARGLVQQILSFSRRQPTERKPTTLAPIIDESVRLLRATLPARMMIEVQCDAAVPAVRVDASQIQQILMNLATNAIQSMPDGSGRIGIRLDTVLLDAAMATAHPALRALHEKYPGCTLRLAVSDSGLGMDAATLARVFEPFFTTKAVDQGTGLGLSVVHGLVQAHEGEILVASQLGKGTTFTIYLPTSLVQPDAPEPDHSVAIAAPPCAVGGRHILYLDDDESLVYLITRLLERRGFRISGFIDQRKALDALRAAPTAFDLVVTDYNMPGMSGLDVAREVHSIRADLAVAVASGFIDESLRAQADAAGVRELIFKANAVEDLCDAFARLAQAVGEQSKHG